MAAHRYWRIFPTQAKSIGNYCEIGQIELHTVVGGPTVTGSGTAIQSGSYSGYAAAKSFDGVLTDFWCSPTAANPPIDWMGYDFGAGHAFDIVEIKYYTANDNAGDFVIGFNFDYSDDGVTWT